MEGRADLLRLTPPMSRSGEQNNEHVPLYAVFTSQLLLQLHLSNPESLLLLHATAAIRSNAGIYLPLLGRSPQVMNKTVIMFPIPNVMSNLLRAAYLRSPPLLLLPYRQSDEHSAARIAATPNRPMSEYARTLRRRHCTDEPTSALLAAAFFRLAVCPELNQSQSPISTFTPCPWPNFVAAKARSRQSTLPSNQHFCTRDQGGYHLALHEDRIVVRLLGHIAPH